MSRPLPQARRTQGCRTPAALLAPLVLGTSIAAWAAPADDARSSHAVPVPPGVGSLTVVAAAARGEVGEGVASAAAVYFDDALLKSRNISPALAQRFSRQPRFSPGEQLVDVILNGRHIGRHLATFSNEGKLCFTPVFANSIGIRLRHPLPDSAGGTCLSAEEAVSEQSVVRADVGEQALDIAVPEALLQSVGKQFQFTRGGTGGLLNYDVYHTRSEYASGSAFRSSYAQVEGGLNVDDVMLRVRARHFRSDGRGSTTQTAFIQKTFESEKQQLQFGQLSSRDPLFGGAPLVGLQWLPEDALRFAGSVYPIAGFADTRARVEVREGATLLLSTVVPPGPFRLVGYDTPSGHSDLQVRVIEEAGTEHAFSVPASALAQYNTAVSEGGLWLAAGTLDSEDLVDAYLDDPVASASFGGRVDDWVVVGGVAASTSYLSVGASAATAMIPDVASVSGEVHASADDRSNTEGLYARLSSQYRFNERMVLGLSGNVRTRGYRRLTEALSTVDPQLWERSGARSQISASASAYSELFGAFMLGYTQQRDFGGGPSNSFSLGWSRALPLGASVSVSAVRNMDRTVRNYSPGYPSDAVSVEGGTSVYVGLSVPLGAKATARAFMEKRQDSARYGVSGHAAATDWLSLSAGHDSGDDVESSSYVGATVVPRFVSVGLGASHSSAYDSQYVQVAGGAAFTSSAFALSPYRVQDSYAMVETGDLSGLKISTPHGPVWSLPNGSAVVPSLQPYRPTIVEVDGASAGTDAEIGVGKFEVKASRGAVVSLDTKSFKVKRTLLELTDASGQRMAAGLPIVDGEGNYVSSTGAGGRALITSKTPDGQFFVELTPEMRCRIGEVSMKARAEGAVLDEGYAKCM